MMVTIDVELRVVLLNDFSHISVGRIIERYPLTDGSGSAVTSGVAGSGSCGYETELAVAEGVAVGEEGIAWKRLE